MQTVEFSSSRLINSKELRARSFSVYSSSLAPVSPLDGSLVIATWSCRDRSVVHPITGREGTSTTWCREPEISEEDHSELVLLGKRPASQSEYPCYDQRTCSILLPCRISQPPPSTRCRYPPVYARCRWSLNLLCWENVRRVGLYLLRQA